MTGGVDGRMVATKTGSPPVAEAVSDRIALPPAHPAVAVGRGLSVWMETVPLAGVCRGMVVARVFDGDGTELPALGGDSTRELATDRYLRVRSTGSLPVAAASIEVRLRWVPAFAGNAFSVRQASATLVPR